MTASLDLIEWRLDLQSRAETTPDWFDYVRGTGIDMRSIYAHGGILAVTRCSFLPGGRFDWATEDSGELSAVIEVVEIERGEPVTRDIVAWSVAEPARFGTAFGSASLLGADQIANPSSYFAGQRLLVHRNPLDWVRAGCSGVVVLDRLRGLPRLAEARGELMAADVEHARRLVRGFGAMFDPNRIYVPASCVRGAA